MRQSPAWQMGMGEVFFSLKTFAAAILALGIAFGFGFSKPYWALATVYIVSQPLSGAVTSKAFYRVLGTVLGAVAALALVPNLVDAPILLCLALSAWIGFCLFISLLDRTPRSYVFMLSGYTAAIIGFSSVNSPELVFDISVARVQEITLGIVCAALVSRLVFPRHVAPVLTKRTNHWLGDAAAWARAVAQGRLTRQASQQWAHRLASDTLALVALTAYLPFDTPTFLQARRQMNILEQHMTALIPLIAAVEDRLALLQRDGAARPEAVQVVLEKVVAWMHAGWKGAPETAARLREELDQFKQPHSQCAQVRDWMTWNLSHRLRDLVDVWQDCQELQQSIAEGTDKIPSHLEVADRYAAGPVLHLNFGVAVVSGLAAFAGTMVACGLWISTGWVDGAAAAELTPVFCCIFASFDNPLPLLRTNIFCLAAAMLIAAIYQFLVFPAVDGFPLLMLVLSPFLVTGGLFMASPIWGFPSFALCMNGCVMLNLEDTFNPNLTGFLNSNLAALLAGVIAMTVVTLFRTVNAEAGAGHLLRAVWSDIANLAANPDLQDRMTFVRRMVDRLGLIVPRLAGLPPGSALHSMDALLDMRVGLNLADIQRVQPILAGWEQEAAQAALASVGNHFRERLKDARIQPPESLLNAVNGEILRLAARSPQSEGGNALLHALLGLRLCLFPKAPLSLKADLSPAANTA